VSRSGAKYDAPESLLGRAKMDISHAAAYRLLPRSAGGCAERFPL